MSDDPTSLPWRVGRSVGRTIYACPPGSEPRKGEALIGVMDSAELAAEAVDAHNHMLLRRMVSEQVNT